MKIIMNENKIKLENRLGKKNINIFFTLCHQPLKNTFILPFQITVPLSPSSPQLQSRHHNIDNFLRHHIIVNIFP